MLAAYANMAIGIVGIVVTALNAPTFVQLTTAVGGDQIEPLGRSVRIGGLLLLLVTFAFLLALGVTLTLLPFARSMGASSPVLTTVLIVAFLYASAFTGTLAHFRAP